MSLAQKEFIVTLKDYSFLEEFYLDMETEGTTKLYVPVRSIECVNRRPVSRNTHYLLTDDEARLLMQDPRVESVNLKISTETIKIKSHSSQTADWNRGSSIQAGEKNWGLYRSQIRENIPQWGGESASNTETASVSFTSTGKNVDVVIVDETVWPNHPEYDDRFVEYDWFANHNSTVWPANPNANYTYINFDFVNNHATNVAGIIAGTTQGWAREANIYNIRHDVTGGGSFIPHELLIDYIRQFHANKPINPETGRRNPTIVNNSWGFEYTNNRLNPYPDFLNPTNPNISKVIYRGSNVPGSLPQRDTGFSGVFTSSAKVADLNSVAPGTGNRIVTTDISAGTVTSIPFVDTNRVGLTNRGAPTSFDNLGVDSNDDALWSVPLPFSATFFTDNYPTVHVCSNSYVTFGAGSFTFEVSGASPGLRKIMVSASDRAASAIYSGTFGTSPNRTFTIRYEGFEGPYSPTYETIPTIIWEMTFYENATNQIDLHVVQNGAYRTEYTPGDLASYGINYNLGTSPVRNNTIDSDILDAINEGIIFVGSAGNNGAKIDVTTGLDYDNYFIDDGLPVYYHRGTSPGSGHPDVICVGALDSSSQENKFQISNTGPRVDVYAPGSNITSSVFDNTATFLGLGATGSVVGSSSLTISGGFAGTGSVLAQAGRAAIVTNEIHGLTNGDIINIDNCSNTVYNVTNAVVTVVDANTVSFDITDTVYTSGLEFLTGTVKVGGLTQKWSGTSMAAAQVTGLLALALEQYPWMTQSDAKAYITRYATLGEMFTTGGSYTDNTSLQGGENKIAYYYKERPEQGQLIPKDKQWLRPETGQLYPRPKIKRK